MVGPKVLAWALLVSLVAGCVQGGERKESDASDVDATDASLTGVVVDLAIRPLAGATASIAGVPQVQTTDADGLFHFTGLSPGVTLVQVEKPGYLTTTVQGTASTEADALVLKVVLEPLQETTPYIVQETFSGLVDCGVGSQVVFGLTFQCTGTVGAGVNNLCRGGAPPIPPTGVCLEEVNPYFAPQARGNITIAQSEITWKPTVQGQSQLLLTTSVVDDKGAFVAGAGYGVTGPPFLVERLNTTFLREHDVGGANHLNVYVSTGNGPAVNLAVNQAYDGFHTSTYFFEPDADWAFVRDGAPTIPPTCTTCLLPR